MDHRKFRRLMNELGAELTLSQTERLIQALQDRGAANEVCRLIETAFEEDPRCPYCREAKLGRWGKSHGLRRYRCKNCGKTFNALTGTPLARLRMKDRWLDFADCLRQSHSVRRAAAECEIGKVTSFRWRHRFLSVLKAAKAPVLGAPVLEGPVLEGIVEVDETFVLKSSKGRRGLPRAPRKRGGKATKSGLSDEYVPVLIARDRSGNMVDAVLPARSKEAVSAALAGAVSKDALICMDGDKALIAFARDQGIEYEPVIVSRDGHVCEGVLHVQNVNAYASRLKGWLRRFNGVATDYLASYLGWRRMLDSAGDLLTAEDCLLAAIR